MVFEQVGGGHLAGQKALVMGYSGGSWAVPGGVAELAELAVSSFHAGPGCWGSVGVSFFPK